MALCSAFANRRKMRSVRDTTTLTLLWVGRLLFKGAALIVGLMLIVAVWFWDASLLTEAADQNLNLIREATRLLPDSWSSRVESALRIFGADRALLLTEAVAVAKLIMLTIGRPFRPGR